MRNYNMYHMYHFQRFALDFGYAALFVRCGASRRTQYAPST
jgi:hypothetical protein